MVEDHPIGRLDGFRFTVAPDARAARQAPVAGGGGKAAGGRGARRAAGADRRRRTTAFALGRSMRAVPVSVARERLVARTACAPGRRSLDPPTDQARPRARCLDAAVARGGAGAARRAGWRDSSCGICRCSASSDAAAAIPPPARRCARSRRCWWRPAADRAAPPLARSARCARSPAARKRLRAARDHDRHARLFDPRLLKPAAAQWRRAAVMRGLARRPPAEGATVLPRDSPARGLPGFRPLGAQAVRIDLVERIARAAHDARSRAHAVRARSRARDIDRAQPRDARAADGRARLSRRAARRGWPRAGCGTGSPARRRRSAPPRDNAFAALRGWMRRMADGAAMRLDRFLWFARIAKTRSAGAGAGRAGHLRIDGRPVDRAAAPVRARQRPDLRRARRRGPRDPRRALAPRRGPAPEAQRAAIERPVALRTSRSKRRLIDDARVAGIADLRPDRSGQGSPQ